MAACTVPGTLPISKNDYFQRKKVGSIRDNPKLMKIRQRFEDASQNITQDTKSYPDSAPSSITFSRRTDSSVFEELIKSNSVYSDKTISFLKSQLGIRRHSEGEADSRSSLSVFVSKQSKSEQNSSSHLHTESDQEYKSGLASISCVSKTDNCAFQPIKNAEQFNKMNDDSSTKQGEYKIVSNILASENTATLPTFSKTSKIDNKVQLFESIDVSAPPIPKRGISRSVKKNIVNPLSLSTSQNIPAASTDF